MTSSLMAALLAAPLVAVSASLERPSAEQSDAFPVPEQINGDECVTAETAMGDLHRTVALNGGIGGIMRANTAQTFADIWREHAGTEAVTVSFVLIWVQRHVTVAEIGEDDCMATMTVLPPDRFRTLLDGLPKVEPRINI